VNKSYKTVWNETTGTYVAAPEVAKSRGKKSKSKKVLVVAMLAAGVGGAIEARAGALDGGTVTSATDGSIAYQAAAVGASARITQNLKVKIGAGISAAGTSVGAGASYQW
jgi:trimeric autotransporter adhesin